MRGDFSACRVTNTTFPIGCINHTSLSLSFTPLCSTYAPTPNNLQLQGEPIATRVLVSNAFLSPIHPARSCHTACHARARTGVLKRISTSRQHPTQYALWPHAGKARHGNCTLASRQRTKQVVTHCSFQQSAALHHGAQHRYGNAAKLLREQHAIISTQSHTLQQNAQSTPHTVSTLSRNICTRGCTPPQTRLRVCLENTQRPDSVKRINEREKEGRNKERRSICGMCAHAKLVAFSFILLHSLVTEL
ncbi:hypothetical protein TRVL_09697 [Trypanosoma vivax]|nr:hypothetical protein TRVL_09697 [Trypanosoma vivax]